jgi:hypothetical protein
MANVDNPDGFRPIKTLNGMPLSGMVRAVTPGADDLYIGDPITITAGVAVQAAVEGVVAGVIVGFGGDDIEGNVLGYNPDNLTKRWFDTSADTEADWTVWYVPAEGILFEAQFDDTEDIVIGEGYDMTVADAGNTTTGRSAFEIDGNAKTNDGDVVVIEFPRGPKYDQTSGEANKRVWVSFVNTMGGQI